MTNLLIGQRIKELRLSKKLTQQELANRIGVTTSAIGMYELSKRKPSYKVIVKMAIFFNVSVDYLIGLNR